MDKVYYLIISIDLVSVMKKRNVEMSVIKNVLHFEYHIYS